MRFEDPVTGKKTAMGRLFQSRQYQNLNDNIVTPTTEMAVGDGAAKVFEGAASLLLKGASKTITNIKYLGRLEDLKGIPGSQTLIDDLPNLGSPKANYYQNMSIVRRNLREGVTFKDASWFRPNSELAPTLSWPTRTVGQTFYGAERNLMQNRGLWPK